MTLVAFEGISVATIMPAAAGDLDGLGAYAWAFNTYIVTSLVGMVVAGTWCDRVGPRIPMVLGVGLFALGAAVAAVAPVMAVLVVGRGLQGLGGGAGIVAVYVLIARGFAEAIRPRAFSLLSAAWVVPSLVGPFIAGWLTDVVSWRAVFALVPLVVVLPAVVLLPVLGRYDGGDPDGGRPGRTRAALVVAAGLLLAQTGLGRAGTGDAVTAITGVGLAVLGLALAVVAARGLLPAGTLRLRRGLPTTVLLRGVLSAGFFAGEVFVPLSLVTLREVSTTASGLVLTTGAIGWVCGSAVQARLPASLDRGRVVRVGALVSAVGVAVLPLALVPALPAWLAAVGWAIGTVGMGLSFPSISVQTLALSAPQEQGVNSSSLQMVDAMCSALAIAAAGAVQSAAVAAGGATRATYTAIWLGGALVLVAGAVLAGRMTPGRSGVLGSPSSTVPSS